MRPSASLFRTFCCGLFLLLAAFTAQAQIIYVTPNGAGDNSGSSWINAAPGTQLQSKINGAASGSQVWVAAGTYKPTTGTDRNASFFMKEGVTIYGGFAGSESALDKRPAITFSHPSTTVLSGDIGVAGNVDDNSFHVFYHYNKTLNAASVLDGFVIRDGNANGGDFLNNTGGGMFTYNDWGNSNPTVRKCLFSNNRGTGGGAVFSSVANPTFINCRFSNNSSNYFGGAVFNGSGEHPYINCVFTNNYTSNSGGAGAIHTLQGSTLITNCSFYGNGDGTIGHQDPAGSTIITNSIVWGNTGSRGMFIRFGNGSIQIRNSDVDADGYADQNGNMRENPQFVDAANGNLQLMPNSPAINRGNNADNNTSTDLNSLPRIYGSTIDMGAYEFQCDPITITNQPQNTSACAGGTATFSIAVSGTPLPSIQWQYSYNGGSSWININTVSSTSVSIPTADLSGVYKVRAQVANTCGAVNSEVVDLTLNTKPVVTVPANITANSGEATCGASISFAATATGVPAPSITYTIGEMQVTSPYTFPLGTTTVTATAANTCGTGSKTFTVTVEDKTAPTFTAPAGRNVSLGANCSITIPDLTAGLSGSDNCGVVTFSQTPVAGTTIAYGHNQHNQTRTVVITANDGNGNTTQYDVTLTAKDNTLPTITAPAAISVSTDGGACSRSNVALGTPTYSDNCTGIMLTSNAPLVFPKGITTVTWTVTDGAGNKATATQTVTVEDKEAPAAPNLPAIIAECSTAVTPVNGTDNCAGAVVPTTDDPLTYTEQGTYTIHWTYSDGNGNSTVKEQTVVIKDVTKPVADAANLPDIAVECSATVTIRPTAIDNCSGKVTATTTDPLSYTMQGTYTIHWTYSDGNGNSMVKEQTVIVKDVTKPVPDAATLPEVNGECSVSITNKPTATDNCTGRITATTTDPLTYTAQGTYTINWIYSDGNGNTSTQEQTVVIKDVTLPTITAPSVLIVSADAGACSRSNVALGTPVSSDNCAVASVSNNAPVVFPKGETVVTWTVTDAAGNQSTATQSVTVTDNEKPVITCLAAPATLCYSSTGNYTIAPLQASDNCAVASTTYAITGATTRSGSGNNASGVFNPGTSTITWTVKDASNNTATCQTTVVVNSSLHVSIPDAKVLSSGVDLNTVYLGYTPAGTITLSATVSGGSGSYLYKWSTGATSPSIKVSPTAQTTYTVTVTDVKGCTGMANKQVQVINAACGSKVNVCHKDGNTLCIDKTSVPDHLGHGDYLGACRTATSTKTAVGARLSSDILELRQLLELSASPNPSTAYFTLQIKGNADERVVLTITDALGRVIESKSISTGTVQVGGSYLPGIYIVTAMQGSSRSSVKLLKQ